MGWFRKKKIQKYFAIFFFAALMFPGFFLFSQNVWAEGEDIITGPGSGVVSDQAKTLGTKNTSATSATPVASPVVTPGTCSWYEVGCQIRQLIIELLGMFLSFLFRFVMIPAATGFAWTVDPATMTGPSGTLNLAAVYNLWQFIRDFFNLFFILILLFSAFATIFQVDSFNIRNIFKNILLVALFINFSFPITRFLIDAANVPMYYFINDVLGNGSGSGGMIAMKSMFAYSGTGAAAFTNVQDGDMAPLIMGIIFVFLFSISLFVLALMMIIRLIALTMLLIFSPIGFAASLLPGLDKFGREWWENFWKYALFGPSAALMLMISIKFMAGVAGSGIWKNLGDYAGGQSPDAASATFLAQVVFFCIPIIMIWFTIGMAQKSSLVGASVVVGLGYALPKAIGNYTKTKVVNTGQFVGRKVGSGVATVTGVKLARDTFQSWNKSREAARADSKDRSWGTKAGKWVAGKQDDVVARRGVTAGQRDDARARIDADDTKKTKEAGEKGQMAEKSVGELHDISRNEKGDKHERAAALQELAKKGALDMADPKTEKVVHSMRDEFGETGTVFRQLNNKIRQYDPVAAFKNMTKDADGKPITVEQRDARMRDYIKTNEFDVKKVGANSFGSKDFVRALLEEGGASMKDLEEVAKKDAHKTNLTASLGAIATAADSGRKDASGSPIAWSLADKRDKAIQEAHFNFSGEVSDAVHADDAWKKDMFSKLSKDFGTRMKRSSLRDNNMDLIAESVSPGEYRNWIQGTKDKSLSRDFNHFVLNSTFSNNDSKALSRMANGDSYLQNYKN